MSIQDEITRIETAKSDIANSIGSKGVTVPDGASLNEMAMFISQISGGGGGSGEGSSFNYRTNSYTVAPDYDFIWGAEHLTNITAYGSVTVIIKAEVEARNACDGNINVLVNGLKAGQSRFIGEAGDKAVNTMYCAVYITGNADLSISSDCDCTLRKCQIFVVGGGATLDVPSGQLSFCKKDDTWLVAYIQGGTALFSSFTEDNPQPTSPYFLGRNAKTVDLVAYRTGYVFCYTDNQGNVFVRETDKNYSSLFVSCVETNATYSTIIVYEDNIYVASVVDGKLRYRKLDNTGAFSEAVEIVSTGTVKEAYFVKNVEQPMLVIRDGNNCYLYRTKPETSGSDVIDLALIIAFGS